MHKASHGGPVVTTRTTSVPVSTSMDIENQGSIPYAQTVDVPMPASPVKGFTSKGQRAGEQTARGFGLQMRPTKFVVR